VLPSSLSETSAVRSASDKSCDLAATPPKQILVIEDHTQIRELLVKLMVRLGFGADSVRNGEEGWRAICIRGYDLVITDHELPKLDGLNFIRRLREVSVRPPCILLFATLLEPESTVRQLIDPGAVLAKPFKASVLVEIVRSLLKTRRQLT
jgi:DNA-binding response OmpR family regulator